MHQQKQLNRKTLYGVYFPLEITLIDTKWIIRNEKSIADSAISISVAIILIFFRKDLNDSLETKKIDTKLCINLLYIKINKSYLIASNN